MKNIPHFVGALLLMVPSLFLVGCIDSTPVNPSFSVTPNQAQKALSNAAAHPKPLRRPLVIVGGFLDPLGSQLLAHDFRNYFHDDACIIAVPLFAAGSFEDCRKRIVDAVDGAFPGTDPRWTTEVDVIGVSLGGLAARYAAEPPKTPGIRRLCIARLFTIASPLRGANLANWLPCNLHPLQASMRSGSPMLKSMDAAAYEPGNCYPIYPYVCATDYIVGADNAAPADRIAWWINRVPWMPPHSSAYLDPRIRADIVRRLRDEPAWATLPAAPLPANASSHSPTTIAAR